MFVMKWKSLEKGVCFCLICIMLLLLPLSANASNIPAEVIYDLKKGGKQEFTIKDSTGQYVYVTVTEISSVSRVSNGTYKVSYRVPFVWKAGFYIDIGERL